MFNGRNNFSNQQSSPIQKHNKSQQPNTSPLTSSNFNNIRSMDLPLRRKENAELWKSRCDDLESSLCQANTDLELANFRARKAQEIEEKYEEAIRQISFFQREVEILQKSLNQTKAESDIWRQKYESQMNNLIQNKQSYELEIKKLQVENNRIRDEVKQQEIEKNKLVEQTKYKLNVEMAEKREKTKKNYENSIQIYETQLKKLREILEDREKEIIYLQQQIQQTKYEGISENTRISEDKEKLKMRISELEMQTQIETEKIREKLDSQASEYLFSLKKLHDNEVEVLCGEINKLRNLLEVKGKEIETLIQQNKCLKGNFDQENKILRDEILSLKEKMSSSSNFATAQIEELREQFANQNVCDIQGLKYHHENQLESLNQEIDALKSILQTKQIELDNQIKEKNSQRDSFSQELQRVNNDIENWKCKYQESEKARQREMQENTQKLNTLNQNQNEFLSQQKEQIQYLEEEIETLKKLLMTKNDEIDCNRNQFNEIRKSLEQDNQTSLQNIEDLKKKNNILQQQMDVLVSDLKSKLSIQENKCSEMLKKNDNIVKFLEQDMNRLKETLQIKENEIQNCTKHKDLQEKEIKKLKQEIESQQLHSLNLEKLKAKELETLRNRMENSNFYAIEQIKISHQNQINIMNGEIEDLKNLISIKNNEINELSNKYDKLENVLNEFKYNTDKIKDYQTQCNNLTNEIISNRPAIDSQMKGKHSRYPSSTFSHKN